MIILFIFFEGSLKDGLFCPQKEARHLLYTKVSVGCPFHFNVVFGDCWNIGEISKQECAQSIISWMSIDLRCGRFKPFRKLFSPRDFTDAVMAAVLCRLMILLCLFTTWSLMFPGLQFMWKPWCSFLLAQCKPSLMVLPTNVLPMSSLCYRSQTSLAKPKRLMLSIPWHSLWSAQPLSGWGATRDRDKCPAPSSTFLFRPHEWLTGCHGNQVLRWRMETALFTQFMRPSSCTWFTHLHLKETPQTFRGFMNKSDIHNRLRRNAIW